MHYYDKGVPQWNYTTKKIDKKLFLLIFNFYKEQPWQRNMGLEEAINCMQNNSYILTAYYYNNSYVETFSSTIKM